MSANLRKVLTRSLYGSRRCLSSSAASNFVRIVDVSPRDGLQNEKAQVPSEVKLELIDRLTDCGVQTIEATSFVSPKWVPQMGDAKDLYPQVLAKYSGNGRSYPVLTPNAKGLEGALAAAERAGRPLEEVAIFGAASEGFSKKNTNRSVDESFKAFQEVVEQAKKSNVRVRAYLSTVIGCPYDGATDPQLVARLTQRFLEMGCYEVSLGDTIGVGTPSTIERMLSEVMKSIPADKLAIHAHDTYGQGVANVLQAVNMGIRVVDSCVGGLGGCPFANGATGNVSTEDVVYALHGLGYQTGIDLNKLSYTGEWICSKINKPNGSKAGKAIITKLEKAKL
ncbi:hypothetical protein TRICI_004215 [Trichomonascus ciferrii]|uniref:hydroxymethylglutaryl-CoA lyase n=1 Tax=Trichomonascus ciferrii TaxID=44093 RepID=A0A642V2X4_9ASCO|nr:hypothetical protein TRICI_004215 [Trichomonascus ciferrii]